MGLLGHEFLKAKRLELGLSLRELDARCGVSYKQIKDIEDGKAMPGVDTLFRLCNGLGISIYDYLNAIGVKPPKKRGKKVAVQGFEPRTLRI